MASFFEPSGHFCNQPKCGREFRNNIFKTTWLIRFTVLQDGAEKKFAFDTYRVEVIKSDITTELLHKVAIHYISATLALYEIIGDYLLLAKGDKTLENSAGPAETFLIKVQPGMTIVSYKEIKL